MKIGTKITLKFNFIVSVILISFAASVYFSFSSYREEEFYSRLKEEATTTAKLYSDVEEVTYDVLKKIDKISENILTDEKVLIYDLDNKLLYSNQEIDVDEISHAKLDELKTEKEIRYKEGDIEFFGTLFTGKFNKFLVISCAMDEYGLSKLQFLKYTLIIGVIIALIISTFLSFFFSRQSLSPISDVIKQVDIITISNLNHRVNEGNGKDEIAQLAIKFNKMLERLEAAFEMQRSFVSNASHELRTPLTAITGQIEVAIMGDNVNKEAQYLLNSILDDIKELNKLSNGLLDLAHANLDISEVKLSFIRIDEIIGAIQAEIVKRNKDYTIEIDFMDYPDEENWITINASDQLIKAALANVIENACKYSARHVANISLEFDNKNVTIIIQDSGIGIPEENMAHIFEPFYRADNVKLIKGHGIGLTLTQRIIHLHNGTINIQSSIGKGTIVKLQLPHL